MLSSTFLSSTETHLLHVHTFCQNTYTGNMYKLLNITVNVSILYKSHYLDARHSEIFLEIVACFVYKMCFMYSRASQKLLFSYTKVVLITIVT